MTLAGAYTGNSTAAIYISSSPYNTYRNRAFAAGPIFQSAKRVSAQPSIPPPTDDLYFVAIPKAGHSSGKTLQEHNRNVAR